VTIASVHLADVSARRALAVLRRAPSGASAPGLRHANVAVAAQLRTSSVAAPQFRRVALIAFWDDDDALDRFLDAHTMAAALKGGWHARLEPLRAWGAWPGLPTDTPKTRNVDTHGPAAVLTLGRLRPTQAVRFFRTSARAERAAREAPGLTWGTALARPPFVATCSLWQSTQALSAYAFGRTPAHPDAIAADKAKPFHHQSAFIRFRPYDSVGSLGGKNPLPERWMAAT
jgi:hypothetical protein